MDTDEKIEKARDMILDKQFEVIGSDGIRRSVVNVESIELVFEDLGLTRKKPPF